MLMRDDFATRPELRTLPLSDGDIDTRIVSIMGCYGIGDPLTAAQFLEEDTEATMLYRILRRMTVEAALPVFCQSVLLQPDLSINKARSTDERIILKMQRHSHGGGRPEPDGTVIRARESLPGFALQRGSLPQPRAIQRVRVPPRRAMSVRLHATPGRLPQRRGTTRRAVVWA
jgi:hypothetical protein